MIGNEFAIIAELIVCGEVVIATASQRKQKQIKLFRVCRQVGIPMVITTINRIH